MKRFSVFADRFKVTGLGAKTFVQRAQQALAPWAGSITITRVCKRRQVVEGVADCHAGLEFLVNLLSAWRGESVVLSRL